MCDDLGGGVLRPTQQVEPRPGIPGRLDAEIRIGTGRVPPRDPRPRASAQEGFDLAVQLDALRLRADRVQFGQMGAN